MITKSLKAKEEGSIVSKMCHGGRGERYLEYERLNPL